MKEQHSLSHPLNTSSLHMPLHLKIMYKKRQRGKNGCKCELDKIKSYSNKIFAKERLMHDEKEFNFAFLRQDAGNGK